MDALTRKAVELARGGAWELLDALEVVARANTCEDFVGIAHAPGSIALAAYRLPQDESADDDAERMTKCGFFDGDGDVDVYGANGTRRSVTCPECDGEGEVPADSCSASKRRHRHHEAFEAAYWYTLAGVPVEPPTPDKPMWLLTVREARIVIETAERTMKRTTPEAA